MFAFDGEGVTALKVLGNFMDMCAQCIMMLELLFIAKGWTISCKVINRKILLYIIWGLYTAVYIVLFVFNMVSLYIRHLSVQ